MQLNLFDDIYVLKGEGFGVNKPFQAGNNDKFKELESTYSILLNGNTILYVQDNHNGTYNTFGYHHERFGIKIKKVIEILKNKNNWCLYSKALEESE